MKNLNWKLPALIILIVIMIGKVSYGQTTDRYGNALEKKYFFVFKEAHGDEHAVFSRTIQFTESNRSIETDVLSQWLDEIKVHHSDLIQKYGADRIYSLSFVKVYGTRDEAEKEKREQMATETEKGAKVISVNFGYIKGFTE